MTARQLPNGLWEVESRSDPDSNHIVDLKGCCTCKHYQFRLVGTDRTCAHIDAARAQSAQEKAKRTFSTAARVPDALLPVLLEKHAGDPAIATALLYERERRRRREEANAALKAVFS